MPQEVDRRRVQELMSDGAHVIDVLPPPEYRALHLAGAINIPLKQMAPETVRQLDRSRPVIVYCHDYQ